MERVFGLIGKKLGHSFSKKYFTEKFQKENIPNCKYELFEIPSIEELQLVIDTPGLKGLNITIPYKEEAIPYLTTLDASAEKVGAVNVIKISSTGLTGYNTDYFGFKQSLQQWLPNTDMKALILGSGGASKAVKAVLQDLDISYMLVSRSLENGDITYQQLTDQGDILKEHHLIINTTPLGMSPDIKACPNLNYDMIGQQHYLYDLIYNPEETRFLSLGLDRGAKIKNGLEMLILQAEKSWEIWNG